jgi:hypothetical protein
MDAKISGALESEKRRNQTFHLGAYRFQFGGNQKTCTDPISFSEKIFCGFGIRREALDMYSTTMSFGEICDCYAGVCGERQP